MKEKGDLQWQWAKIRKWILKNIRAEVQTLVIKGVITQDIMDGTMAIVARENDLLDVVDISSNKSQHMDSSVRTITILPANSNMKEISPPESPVLTAAPNSAPVLAPGYMGELALGEPPMPAYISLTELVRSHHMENPSYVIQSWMRSENTLAL